MNNGLLTNTQGKPKKYFTLLNAYHGFVQVNKEYGPKGSIPIPLKTYRTICEEFNEIISAEMLKGNEYKMPGRLGNLRVLKSKTKLDSKKLKMDYGHYKKTGEKIFHLNRHSNGFKVRWYWGKKNCKVKHKTFYCFKPSRENKRKLTEVMFLPDGHKIFQTYI
jgi:hypothetical protein